MKRFFTVAVTTICLGMFQPAVASAASVVAKVNLSTQTMTVMHNGVVKYQWKVSTARSGKVTPTGTWRAKWLSKNHRSSRYNNAPMPYSIFYNGHYAVHGTNQVSRLGRPASSGCIRLHPSNAAVLYGLAQREGLKNTKIVVVR
jgi:lipoprotein-anchoring transpeptidase ErfK/SrfK